MAVEIATGYSYLMVYTINLVRLGVIRGCGLCYYGDKGAFLYIGMMATQMNAKVTSNELNKFAVIQVEKMIVNAVQNRK